jgi:hypothetical protein
VRLPEPEPGLVIRYSNLWLREHREGREEGTKDRPCAIVLASRRYGDGTQFRPHMDGRKISPPRLNCRRPSTTSRPPLATLMGSCSPKAIYSTGPAPVRAALVIATTALVAYGFLPPRRLPSCAGAPLRWCRYRCEARGAVLSEELSGRFFARGCPRSGQNAKSPGTGWSSFMQRSKNGDLFFTLVPRRTAVALQLVAHPWIGVGAEHLACHVIPDTRAVRCA